MARDSANAWCLAFMARVPDADAGPQSRQSQQGHYGVKGSGVRSRCVAAGKTRMRPWRHGFAAMAHPAMACRRLRPDMRGHTRARRFRRRASTGQTLPAQGAHRSGARWSNEFSEATCMGRFGTSPGCCRGRLSQNVFYLITRGYYGHLRFRFAGL